MLDFFHFVLATSSRLIERLGDVLSHLPISSARSQTWWEIVQSWQTLIGGVIAFVPAALAAVFVWRQLNEQRTQFLNVQEASALKARLKLSRNLSHISHHLDKCYEKLIANNFSHDSHALPDKLLDDVLDAAISARSHNFTYFQTYIEKIQTYASLCGIHADVGGEENLVNCFMVLAEIDALTDRLYPFSRFECEKVKEEKVNLSEIKDRLQHHLRRGKDISGSNLEELLSLHRFGP